MSIEIRALKRNVFKLQQVRLNPAINILITEIWLPSWKKSRRRPAIIAGYVRLVLPEDKDKSR